MGLDEILRRYQGGGQHPLNGILLGLIAGIAAFLLSYFAVLPLLRFLSRKDIEKVFLTRMRRVGGAGILTSVSLGLVVCFRAIWSPAERHLHLSYEIAELLLILSCGYLVLELVLSSFGDWLPRIRGQAPMAPIVKDLIRAVALVSVGILGVRSAFPEVDLGAVITTSAILSVVVGLALQESLSNVFAGIMLTVDRPFKPGDWIEIDGREGKVLDSNWRSTRVQTRDDDLIYIPNSTMAKANIVNLTDPSPEHLARRRVRVEYGAPPNKVRNLLIAMMQRIDGILAAPPPDVYLAEYSEAGIEYELRFWINDNDRRTRIESEVMRGVWYHLKREGISIPFPQREVLLRRERPARAREEVVALLQKVDFLQELPAEDLTMLSEDLSRPIFARGEVICRQGEAGSSFYLIQSGTVGVRVKGTDGVEADVAKLQAGSYFGEMSLLTGDPRRSTCTALEDCELLSLDRESFEVLLRNPAVAQSMSEILASRSQATEKKLNQERETRSRARTPEEEAGSRRILEKIWTIFRFKKP